MTKLCCLNQNTPISQRSSVMQNWLQANCSDSNPLAHLDYHVWDVMLEKHHKLQSKPKTTDELKAAIQTIWKELSQEHIKKAVAN